MAYSPGRSDMPLEESREGVDRRRALRLGVAGPGILGGGVFNAQNKPKGTAAASAKSSSAKSSSHVDPD